MFTRDIVDPARNSSTKKTNLNLFDLRSYFSKYIIDIFFETKFKHYVCFIKHDSLQIAKINVTTINMVKNTACCSNKNVHTITELACLVIDRYTTIHSEYIEFAWIVAQFCDLIAYLDSKLTSWCQADGLGFTRAELLVFTQVFNNR